MAILTADFDFGVRHEGRQAGVYGKLGLGADWCGVQTFTKGLHLCAVINLNNVWGTWNKKIIILVT